MRDLLLTVTGREPVEWTPMNEGGYAPGERWLVRFADGGTAFVKNAWRVEDEILVYSTVSASCLPRLLAYAEDVLVIEDLSGARWGTPVTEADCDALSAAFDELRGVGAPDGIKPVTLTPRWADLAAEPERLLRIGLVSDPAWLRHLDALVAADTADLAGDRLVHRDLWLQNWCRAGSRGAVIVDWYGACAANPMLMRAWGEAGIRAAAGPHGRVLSGEPAWAVAMAGFAAWFLSEDGPDTDPRLIETERREALATLRWACDELDLPYPEPGEELASLGPWRP